MQTISNIKEVKNSTLLPQSIETFNGFAEKKWGGYPVEFCYNAVVDEYKSGKIVKKPSFISQNYYCMRSFNSNTTTDGLYVRTTNADKRPTTTKAFYDYIFSKSGPWRDALPALLFVDKDKNGIPKGVLWYRTDVGCSKLIMNLLTAMRLHTCWGGDWFWFKLVEAGFSKEVAMLLSTNFSWAGQDITISNGPAGKFDEDPRKKLSLSKLGCSKTDMPFSTNYNPSGFKPFLVNKSPKFKGKPLSSGQSVQPNNFIWHEDGIEVNADNLSKSSSEYKKSNIKIVSEKTPIHKYLLSDEKMSSDYIKEVTEKLIKNEMLEV